MKQTSESINLEENIIERLFLFFCFYIDIKEKFIIEKRRKKRIFQGDCRHLLAEASLLAAALASSV